MSTIFRYAMRRSAGAILIWGIALFLIAWPVVLAYDVVQKEQAKIKSNVPFSSSTAVNPLPLKIAKIPKISGIYEKNRMVRYSDG